MNTRTNAVGFGSAVAIIYFVGLAFFLFKFLYQLLKIRQILTKTESGNAFSFFNRLVIDPQLPGFNTIQHHETVHKKQYHSLDVLFVEVLGIITWFNPIVYLYKRSLKSIHEYLADEQAARFMGNKEHYALLLVSNAFRVPVSKLTNSFFNQSLLKKRIYMLNQQKSPKAALLKYGLFLPLFALGLVLSSATLRDNEKLKAVAAEISIEQPLTLFQELALASPQQVWDDFYQFEKKNLKYPSKALLSKKQGDVNIKFSLKNGEVDNIGVAGEAMGSGLEAEVMRSITNYNNFSNIENGDYLFTVNFRLKDESDAAKRCQWPSLAGYTKLTPIVVTAEAGVYDFVSIEKQPEFKGGMVKFYEYLRENVKYPAEAKANKVQGKVFLSFIVETDGELSDIKVDRKLGSGTDEEAIRVLKASPKWTPGMLNGKPVRVKYNIPITFALPADSLKVKVTGYKVTNDSSSVLAVTANEWEANVCA